jgi:transposase
VNIDLSRLPDDVNTLKEIIHSQSASYNTIRQDYTAVQQNYTDLESRHSILKEGYDLLEEQMRLLKSAIYGRKSEQYSKEEGIQACLFNEAEAAVETSTGGDKIEEITVAAHKRVKGGRRPLPPELPRVEVIHDLSESEKICDCSREMSRIGSEISEKLDIVPAKIQVIRDVRYKYACRSCEGADSHSGAVRIAPLSPQVIPQSMATAGLIAWILTSKYADALPLYRQEKIFERLGVDISRATMANWVIHVGKSCERLIELLWQEIRSGPLVNMDETHVQVLNEPGRPNQSKSYMWVFRGGDVEHPSLIFQYEPSRSGKIPQECLSGYKGYIQTDGYAGYDMLGERDGIFHMGCWVHVRRKFLEIVKARPKGSKKNGNADVALTYIRNIYAIEKDADERALSAEGRYPLRQEKSVPLLREFREWLENISPKTPPQGLLGKAISYALKQWERLCRYTEDGRLRPDNNLAENVIRPFVVGRKNWLFAGHPRGARASATIYSLIETAKANDLEPYRYLRYLFERLPMAETESDYRALLPQYADRDLITNMKF